MLDILQTYKTFGDGAKGIEFFNKWAEI